MFFTLFKILCTDVRDWGIFECEVVLYWLNKTTCSYKLSSSKIQTVGHNVSNTWCVYQPSVIHNFIILNKNVFLNCLLLFY